MPVESFRSYPTARVEGKSDSLEEHGQTRGTKVEGRKTEGGGGVFAAALAVSIFSGAAALSHQLLWIRRLVDLLGANADTFYKVVGAFFLGLAFGSWAASRWRPRRVWLGIAAAELGVGLLAAGVLWLGSYAEAFHQSAAIARVAKLLLPIAVVGPPAVLMGLVLPWMAHELGSRRTVMVYGVNTLAGVAGIGITLFFSLPALGLNGATLLAIGLNACAAAVALGFTSRASARDDSEAPATRSDVVPLALAFLSGFVVLGIEVVLQHQLAQLTVNSHLSSGGVLSIVLIALAFAALLVPLVAKLGARALPAALMIAAMACALQPLVLIISRGGLVYISYELLPPAYALEFARMVAIACGPLLLAAGLIFPLLMHPRSAPGKSRIGVLLAVNGIGGWAGAEMTHTWIAPHLGLWQSMSVFGALYGVAALCLLRRHAFWAGPILALLLVGACVLQGRLPDARVAPGERLLAVGIGREGVVAVVEGEPDDRRILFNNTYTLGGSRAQFNQERQALLPVLLHGSAKRVATLGVATGSTVAGATLDPEVSRIDAVELSPLSLTFADRFFRPFNRDIFEDPRVVFSIEDARWVVSRAGGEFDVVMGDLFLPWRTGEGRLFTREHFVNVRKSLREGGLYCQWLPMFQLTRPQFDCIVRTFRSVFPDAMLVRGDFYADMPILGLVGGRTVQAIDWNRVADACVRVRVDGKCLDPLLRHPEGIAMCVIGELPDPGEGPLNTLANGWLEWDAGRNIVGLRKPWFTGAPYATYVQEVHKSARDLVAPRFRSAHESGQAFLTMELLNAAKLAEAAQFSIRARASMPAALRYDQQAVWRYWPMRHRDAVRGE